MEERVVDYLQAYRYVRARRERSPSKSLTK
jgi:hypothetical protein